MSKTIFFVFFVTLISVSSVIAKTEPPAPAASAKAAGPVPPPKAPIDQNLMALAVGALLFGTYTIYTYNQKRKASI